MLRLVSTFPQRSILDKPAEVPAKRLLPAISSFAEAPTAKLLSSWRMDPTLLRHGGSLDATSEISNQA
jgi:hypothetical protein